VELQSPHLAAQYLNNLQQAVMVERRNIAKTGVLLEKAIELAVLNPLFNVYRFREDLLGEPGKAAFRTDLQECRYLNINRLPTILFKRTGKPPILKTGYQSYEALRATVGKMTEPLPSR
jgi:predicted DsbA family dithiol-disulfide isomerase